MNRNWKKWIPKIIRGDILRKLVALFFASLIWVAVATQLQETTTLHNVPVSLEYNPGEITINSEIPTIDVTLRGSPRALNQLRSSDIKIQATMSSNMPVGIYFCDINVSPRNVVKTPPGVHVESIYPNKLQIGVDRIVSRRNIPIKPRFEGELHEGFRMTVRSILPATMDIRGPNRILKDINELLTVPVLLDDTIVRDFETEAELTPIPGVHMERRVHLSVAVQRYSGKRNFPTLAVNLLHDADLPLSPAKKLPSVNVTISGPRIELDKLADTSIHPFVDLSGITTAGSYRRPVRVWIDGPGDLVAELIEPTAINIDVAITPTKTKKIKP